MRIPGGCQAFYDTVILLMEMEDPWGESRRVGMRCDLCDSISYRRLDQLGIPGRIVKEATIGASPSANGFAPPAELSTAARDRSAPGRRGKRG